jgi:hypothetical protein
MYMYWIFTTKVPVSKVVSLSKFISQFTWFHGMRVRDDNFPRGLATIEFRAKKWTVIVLKRSLIKFFQIYPLCIIEFKFIILQETK